MKSVKNLWMTPWLMEPLSFSRPRLNKKLLNLQALCLILKLEALLVPLVQLVLLEPQPYYHQQWMRL
jgi:hypothetical protein